MQQELKCWARPRPLRVAFLLQDDKHADLALDGIFADCYSRWGGRSSLIVPCLNERIAESYWPWLEAYDPDIVYSYVPLSRADILGVHERLSPAHYSFHELGPEPQFGFKPSYKFTPLSSLSTIFKFARYRPAVAAGSSVNIIDSWHTEEPSRFLADNFGTYHASQGGSIYPQDAMTAARLLTIVAPEKQADRRYAVPRDLNSIPSEAIAVEEFAKNRATSISLASTLFAPKLEIRAGRWSKSFNLVVGDTFADRIMFWNARLLIPAWLDTDLCCLRVGLDQMEDPEFLAVLGELLKRRNHVRGDGGGQTQVAVRSLSANATQLANAHEAVLSTRPGSLVTAEPSTGLNDIVPSADALKRAREGSRFGGGLFPRPDWIRFMWSPPTARPPAITPDHLSDAPTRQAFTGGYWCTDFIFQNDGPSLRFAEENLWMLPRRWRMAGAFKPSFVGESWHNVVPPQRRSRDGNLTIFVSAHHPVEKIEVPTAYEALHHALAVDGISAKPDAEHEWIYPPNKVIWMRPSNEARYLTGVLGMTEGLEGAIEFLLHPFLRETFARLGGTPNLAADKMVPTVNRLRTRAPREAAFDLRVEGEKLALADLIVKAARELKRPKIFVSYEDLKERWKVYCAADKGSDQLRGQPDFDWDKYEEEALEEYLIELRRQQMMFQGHQWTCQKCHHRNWVDLDLLSYELSCEVCKQPTQAPVNIHWLFRPNEFLIESLRDHSVLSLVWLLKVLCERSRRSLIFVEPMWFGFTHESDSPDKEADLLAVSDGEAILCEVKSSWRGLRLGDISDFVALAKRLRPDTAVLAVMEAGAGPEVHLENAHRSDLISR